MDAHTTYRQRIDAFLASRDAGTGVALDALRAGITLRTLTEVAAAVSEFSDQAQAIVADTYGPRLACGEGCSYCCRKPGVLVTLPELLRLIVQVESLDEDARRRIVERAHDYVARTAGHGPDEPTDESVPCPLLEDERCTMYAIRPLVCRGYNSTSVAACRMAHRDSRYGVPIFAPLKDVTDGASVGVCAAIDEAGGDGGMFDLGTALYLALESSRSAESLAGDPTALAPARNATWAENLLTAVRTVAAEVAPDRSVL